MPIPDVRLRWDGQFFRTGSNAWTAKQEYDVINVSSPADAVAALAAFGLVLSASNPVTHPRSNLVYLESMDPQPAGFGRWIVNVLWSSSPKGFHPNPGNPLNDPAIYRWVPGIDYDTSERDAYGNPKLNTALDTFLNSSQKSFTTLEFSITRNEPIFNPLTAAKFMNTVNLKPMTILKTWNIDPEAFRRMIRPTTESSTLSPFTPVEYLFQFKAPTSKTIDPDGLWDSFKSRRISEGSRGWFTNGSTPCLASIGVMENGSFIRLSTDVRLDNQGKPIDPSYLVAGKTPIACPTSMPSTVKLEPSTLLDANTGKPVAWFIVSTDYPGVDFGELNL